MNTDQIKGSLKEAAGKVQQKDRRSVQQPGASGEGHGQAGGRQRPEELRRCQGKHQGRHEVILRGRGGHGSAAMAGRGPGARRRRRARGLSCLASSMPLPSCRTRDVFAQASTALAAAAPCPEVARGTLGPVRRPGACSQVLPGRLARPSHGQVSEGGGAADASVFGGCSAGWRLQRRKPSRPPAERRSSAPPMAACSTARVRLRDTRAQKSRPAPAMAAAVCSCGALARLSS